MSRLYTWALDNDDSGVSVLHVALQLIALLCKFFRRK
jgi:hypothetical protein